MVAYYYCSFEVFRSMLNSKTLWLTNLTKSNDSQEVVRLYNNIWDDVKIRLLNSDLDTDTTKFVIQQIEYARGPQVFFDVPYGCCLCFENDLVQQWREYGDNGKGVSVGFELDWFGIKRQLPITSSQITDAIGYEAVQYDSNQLRNVFYIIFYEAIKEEGRNAWIFSILPTFKHYAGFIKNPTFKDEKEIRILYYPVESCESTFDGLSDLNEDIRPHYCLNWANERSSALRSITIGYSCEYTQEDIVKLIDQAGIVGTESVQINISDCSYRERIR